MKKLLLSININNMTAKCINTVRTALLAAGLLAIGINSQMPHLKEISPPTTSSLKTDLDDRKFGKFILHETYHSENVLAHFLMKLVPEALANPRLKVSCNSISVFGTISATLADLAKVFDNKLLTKYLHERRKSTVLTILGQSKQSLKHFSDPRNPHYLPFHIRKKMLAHLVSSEKDGVSLEKCARVLGTSEESLLACSTQELYQLTYPTKKAFHFAQAPLAIRCSLGNTVVITNFMFTP